MTLSEALAEAEKWMDEIDGVEGVAQGQVDGEDCITVFVTLDEVAEKLPETLHGHKVVVEQTGPFQALA